jgi:hypothetical protein
LHRLGCRGVSELRPNSTLVGNILKKAKKFVKAKNWLMQPVAAARRVATADLIIVWNYEITNWKKCVFLWSRLHTYAGRFGVVGILAYYARDRGFDFRTVQTFVCMNMSVCLYGSGYFYVECIYKKNVYKYVFIHYLESITQAL